MTMKIVDGVISSEEGLHGDAKCVVSASSSNLMKLVNKELNPMMALLMGKLKI